jgi:hypothetical protein
MPIQQLKNWNQQMNAGIHEPGRSFGGVRSIAARAFCNQRQDGMPMNVGKG